MWNEKNYEFLSGCDDDDDKNVPKENISEENSNSSYVICFYPIFSIHPTPLHPSSSLSFAYSDLLTKQMFAFTMKGKRQPRKRERERIGRFIKYFSISDLSDAYIPDVKGEVEWEKQESKLFLPSLLIWKPSTSTFRALYLLLLSSLDGKNILHLLFSILYVPHSNEPFSRLSNIHEKSEEIFSLKME